MVQPGYADIAWCYKLRLLTRAYPGLRLPLAHTTSGCGLSEF